MYSDTCRPCAKDAYKPHVGSEACQACPHGLTTNGDVGATKCSKLLCPAGLQRNNEGTHCVQCPSNTYQAIKSSDHCKPCESVFYTEENKGATTCVKQNIVDTVGNRVGISLGIAASILTLLAMTVTIIRWGKKKVKKRREENEVSRSRAIAMHATMRKEEIAIDAVDNKKNPKRGCYESHMGVIRLAHERKLNNVPDDFLWLLLN